MDGTDALSDRIAIVDYGEIVAEGTPHGLRTFISGDIIQIQIPSNEVKKAKVLFEHLKFVKEME